MQTRTESHLWALVDRTSGRGLLALAVGVTLLPAILYWQTGGLRYHGEPDSSFLHALYFSIVTETTLGYGDITPIGWSRAIVCVQVVSGLLIAGLAIAKITSLPGKAARLAIRMSQGTWIEPCCMHDGNVIITLSEIRASDIGLVYKGANYDALGKPLGTFTSVLSGCSDSTLEFHYKNSPSSTEYFDQGIVIIQFLSDPRTGQWGRYVATVQDFGKLRKTIFEGTRASKGEIRVIHDGPRAELLGLLAQYADRVRPIPPETFLDS